MSRQTLTADVAQYLSLEEELVVSVIDEFLLRLHRGAVEYEGLNGDYIGEQLSWDIAPQGYYHVLGFLEWFATCYSWNPGTANEYLGRMGGATRWAPFRHQRDSWTESADYKRIRASRRLGE